MEEIVVSVELLRELMGHAERGLYPLLIKYHEDPAAALAAAYQERGDRLRTLVNLLGNLPPFRDAKGNRPNLIYSSQQQKE